MVAKYLDEQEQASLENFEIDMMDSAGATAEEIAEMCRDYYEESSGWKKAALEKFAKIIAPSPPGADELHINLADMTVRH